MVRDGRRAFAAGDPQGAASQLTEALALWHGPPLADVPPTPLVEAEAERLNELHLGAIELRTTAELACGGHAQAVAEIRRRLADHPLREGLWLLLMQAEPAGSSPGPPRATARPGRSSAPADRPRSSCRPTSPTSPPRRQVKRLLIC